MKKVLTISFMFLTVFLVSSSGYSQDTTASVQPEPITENASAVPANAPKKSFRLGEKIDLSLSVQGKRVSGYTEYHIQFPTEVWVTDGINIYLMPATVHSVLSYPLDGYEAGLKLTAFTIPKHKTNGCYGLELSLSKTLTHPSEAMVDSDWVAVPSINLDKFIFGATKSEAKLRDFKLLAAAGIRLNLNPKIEWTGTVGYNYLYYRYDMIGLSGWYDLDFNESPDPVDMTELTGTNVLDYKVEYHLLNLRTKFELLSSEGLKLFIEGQWFPYVKAIDIDDHLLRYKTGESSCKGSGYSIEGGTKINLFTFPAGAKIYFGGGYELRRIKATGSQIQKWYGDDPATDDFDDTGSVSSPIENTLKLRQNNFSVFIEYKF